ncbi:MAG TPA: transposase [Acetobacteraceae bacterium]|nr:transposase [Acetobacteraceae bacterium]
MPPSPSLGSSPRAGYQFHAVKIINDAVEQARRSEQKTQSLLRGTRYIWLRNPQTLSDRQRATLGGLPTGHLKTARAYQAASPFRSSMISHLSRRGQAI